MGGIALAWFVSIRHGEVVLARRPSISADHPLEVIEPASDGGGLAVESFEESSRGSPEPTASVGASGSRVLTFEAWQAWSDGRIVESIDRFEAAIERDPEDPEPRALYGRLLLMMASHDKARTHLVRASELRPDDPQVWLDLATLYERTLDLARSWDAQARARALADDREIERGSRGFFQIEGRSVLP